MSDLLHILPLSGVGILIGFGGAMLVEIGLACLALAGLYPLPVLGRWWRAIPLLGRSRRLVPFYLAFAVVWWIVGTLGAVPLVPACISRPLSLSIEDGRFAVILGLAFGLTLRNFVDHSHSYDGPPDPDLAS